MGGWHAGDGRLEDGEGGREETKRFVMASVQILGDVGRRFV